MLYQLWENQFKRLKGMYVQIDGPHDKYGVIVSDKQESGTYRIRGLGKTKPRNA